MPVSLDIILSLVNLGAYAVVTIFGISLTRKLYGGKFTSSLPYLISGIFLIFVMVIFDIFIFFWIPSITAETQLLKSSIDILAIVSGLFLIVASYKLYLLKYATEGFEVD